MATANTKRNSSKDNPHDLYCTKPIAVHAAVVDGVFAGVNKVWDCCDGLGHITTALNYHGIESYRSDLIDYGTGAKVMDFLALDEMPSEFRDCDAIVMNPPFKLTPEFLDKALQLHDKVIMFNRVSFLETQDRAFNMISGGWNLTDVFFHSYRVGCSYKGEQPYATAVFYAWYIFDQSKVVRKPEISWIMSAPKIDQ